MQTTLSSAYRDTEWGQQAEAILRACVHCGFCTATCPTYQLLGDELDGPRGRIYQIKQVLEGEPATDTLRQHLDRCLTCRSCETTCPSGVRYAQLLDIGREIVEQQTSRPWHEQAMRYALRKVLPYPARFEPLLKLGYMAKPLLPQAFAEKIPAKPEVKSWDSKPQTRKMLAFAGCAQSVATPATNAATARVLQYLGIELVPVAKAGCCGAVSQHLAATDEAKDFMRRNIDAWWLHIEAGAEAIISTASGCGVMLKDYGELLKHDKQYAEKAQHVAELTKDISEILRDAEFGQFHIEPARQTIAYHSPCTLQHGQKLAGVVEAILRKVGFNLVPVQDAHLCCGSAGTYSLLQPKLSKQLRSNKLTQLEAGKPAVIATANVGCQLHLAGGTDLPVVHWIELIDQVLTH